MTAKDCKTFVDSLNFYGFKATKRRWQLDEQIYALSMALSAIGKDKASNELMAVYNDIENLEANDLIEEKVFE